MRPRLDFFTAGLPPATKRHQCRKQTRQAAQHMAGSAQSLGWYAFDAPQPAAGPGSHVPAGDLMPPGPTRRQASQRGDAPSLELIANHRWAPGQVGLRRRRAWRFGTKVRSAPTPPKLHWFLAEIGAILPIVAGSRTPGGLPPLPTRHPMLSRGRRGLGLPCRGHHPSSSAAEPPYLGTWPLGSSDDSLITRNRCPPGGAGFFGKA
jgi:hypothetical protein